MWSANNHIPTILKGAVSILAVGLFWRIDPRNLESSSFGQRRSVLSLGTDYVVGVFEVGPDASFAWILCQVLSFQCNQAGGKRLASLLAL